MTSPPTDTYTFIVDPSDDAHKRVIGVATPFTRKCATNAWSEQRAPYHRRMGECHVGEHL